MEKEELKVAKVKYGELYRSLDELVENYVKYTARHLLKVP